MDKAPDAFRTISEVAEELDLPQHVLRFWETKFTQIKPMKRGGGRRYYRPDDVDFIRGIRHLLYGQGFTIKGAQRIIKDRGLKYVQNVWKSPTEAVTELVPAAQPQSASLQLISKPSAEVPTSQPLHDVADVIRHVEEGHTLGHEDVRRLQDALSTLSECQRILHDTLRQTQAEEQQAA